MSWAKVDDGWWSHPKVMGLSLSARGLWTTALSWSCAHRSPVVSLGTVDQLGGTLEQADELERSGLWLRWDIVTWEIADWAHMVVINERRRRIPTWKRTAVYERDGWACVECSATVDLTLDHVHPFSKGGSDRMENLRTLCRSCNSRKGARV